MYLDPIKYQGDLKNHEKMHFFSRDIIRVKNPLSADFKFKYDSIWNTVKAGQTKDIERYLAEKYFNDIASHIIGQMIQERGQAALAKHAKSNGELLIDKYLENRNIWDKMPRMDDKELLTKIRNDVIVGLVERFGEDRDVSLPNEQAKLDLNTPLYIQLLSDVTKRPLESTSVVESSGPPTAPPAPVQTQTPADKEEVTVNEG